MRRHIEHLYFGGIDFGGIVNKAIVNSNITIADSPLIGYNNTMTLQQIDDICDEFEAALRKGDTVRIEDFLPKIEEQERASLLQELIEVEIQVILENPPSEDSIRNRLKSLKERFPEHNVLIQSLVRHATQLKQVGDYEILGELGRGGMGTVYKAKHKLLQQTVAIKVLSQDLLDDAQAVGRFKREMQLIGGLVHPNIVRALNAGESNGVHYLAMEYVDGITLQNLVSARAVEQQSPLAPLGERVRVRGAKQIDAPSPHPSPLPEGEGIKQKNLPKGEGMAFPIIPLGAACAMIRQAALGLQNAHELKLVHRDIKPANLMLDSRGTVKILDLGLGKFAEERREDYHSSLTMQGMVIGTVDYIAPEQCEDSGTADVRSDLYSLGCTLYFLLTGKPVYSGSKYDTMRKKLMAHIVGEVPSVRQAIPGLPPAIEAQIEGIVQKVLSKDPADRFQTPIEFAEALEPFASFDELWKLTCEMIPADSAEPRSSIRHSSPYGSVQSSQQNIVSPANRRKWIAICVALNLLIAGLMFGAFFFYLHPWDRRGEATARQIAAKQLRNEWKIAGAQAELQKAIPIWAERYLQTRDEKDFLILLRNQIAFAELRWLHGDIQGARRELQTILESIDRAMKRTPSSPSLLLYQMLAQEHLADLALFGGAASGRNVERLADRIFLYNEAARICEDSYSSGSPIRWKQAILLALHGDVEQAATLLEENTYSDFDEAGRNENGGRRRIVGDRHFAYAHLVRQLAEAVLYYYQSEGSDDRNRKLRTFRQQFVSQDSSVRTSATQPEVVELLLFCSEFLIHDSIKHEDWETLASDILSNRHATANFVRQYPGAIPFMRRFYELLVQSAALVYEHSERPRDKQAQVENIYLILERMRPIAVNTVIPAQAGIQTENVDINSLDPRLRGGDVGGGNAGGERPTLVLFFLPGTTAEPGFVVFYPQDGRSGTLYRLPLTRPMVKQRVPGRAMPLLDEALLAQIVAEQEEGRRIRVSWNDTAAWANVAEALTDAEYPYDDVLPLQP